MRIFGRMISKRRENKMKCVICKTGETKKGFANVSLERDNRIIIIKNVPAEICSNCGEYYLDEEVTESVLNKTETLVKNNAELEVIQFAT